MKRIGDDARTRARGSVVEVAVLIDETAYAHLPGEGNRFAVDVMRSLGLMGTPYDIYLASDLDAVRHCPRYRAFLLLQPYPTALARAVTDAFGARVMTVTPDTPPEQITPHALRQFVALHGVRLYTDRPSCS